MQGSLMLDIAGTVLTAADRQLLRQPEVGGLILFARNIDSPEQVRALCREIRAERPELILAIDQEGGRVQRLRRGVSRLPAMRRFDALPEGLALAEDCGWLMAVEMLAIGLDISFAPVLDLDYGRSEVIGDRAFAANGARAAELAEAFIRGMRRAGMPATGKHFPGHGWAEADSHVAIPEDERSLAAIRAEDLVPFAKLAKDLDGIMPAHVIYPQVDSQPAGFSTRWLQEILRAELGFSGVIFSDDLCMAGAHVAGSMAQRVDAALNAGCDMVLVCNDRAGAIEALQHLQKRKVSEPAVLTRMRASAYAEDYRQTPRWLATVQRLRAAGLID